MVVETGSATANKDRPLVEINNLKMYFPVTSGFKNQTSNFYVHDSRLMI